MSKCYSIHSEIDLPYPIERVFEFFNRPENLEKITPPHLGFQMMTPSPVAMFNGQVLDYVISLHGLPMRWTSVITDYNPPFAFVDTQIKGPYSFWHHRHTFEPLPDGGTRCIDHVTYACPFGILGTLIHPLVKKSLNEIFSFRTAVIEKHGELFFKN